MEQAQRTPEQVALVFEDKKFTYRQLDEMSNSLAHYLREKGIKANDVVPVICRRIKMDYRIAEMNDIENICTLVHEAIKQMEKQGIYQWDALYPTREDFIEDICKNFLYVAEDGNKLAAIYAVSQECEEEYHKCTWNNPNETACVIHISLLNLSFRFHILYSSKNHLLLQILTFLHLYLD